MIKTMWRRGFLTLAVGLCALGLAACQEKEEPAEEVIRPVRAMTVDATPTEGRRKFPGRARAAQEVTLAFEVAGRITSFPANIGDIVRRGDVLVALDQRDFESALSRAQAEVTRAKAQYERVKKAAAVNAVSRQDLSDAQAAYQSAQANISIREKALEDATLTAPYDAVVVATFFENFENVQPKQPVVRLLDPRQIEMVVDIPEDLITLVKPGVEVIAAFDAAPGLELSATVTEIGAEASQTTRTYPVTIIMDQPEGGPTILPGMAGTVWGKGGQDERKIGFQVPMTALATDESGATFVWVIDPAAGTAARRAITTGEVTRGGILVTQGLEGGEVIATAGVNVLIEGQKVRIVTE